MKGTIHSLVAKDFARERLTIQVLDATPLEEIAAARLALKEWIKRHLFETGMAMRLNSFLCWKMLRWKKRNPQTKELSGSVLSNIWLAHLRLEGEITKI